MGNFSWCPQALPAPETSRLLRSCRWGEIWAVKWGGKGEPNLPIGIPQLMQRLLIYGGVGLISAGLTLVGLQTLLADRLERAALTNLANATTFSLRLADLALERFPREAVAEISGLTLAATPPPQPREADPLLERQSAGLQAELCRQVETCLPVLPSQAPNRGVWVELPSTSMETSWLFAPLPLPHPWPPPTELLNLAVLAGCLVSTTLYLALEVRRPLGQLRRSLNAVDLEASSAPLPERGTAAVRQLTSRFNAMLLRLEAGRQERASMLAGIGHDLRSPLTRLRLRLSLAEQRPLRSEEQQRSRADLDALERIVNQFIAFAAGAESEAAVLLPLNQLVGEALAAVSAPIELRLMPMERWVRPIGLSRALANLADNALSHGKPPLLVVLEPIGDQGFRISLADCGEGIPPSLWQQAIEPFQRLDPARGNAGHCGLGLAIVERVARAHGGHLSCRALQPDPERPQRFAVEFSGWSQPVTTPVGAVIPQSHLSSRLDLTSKSKAQ
jgi:two-component system osmolarity sensor histidine kinase EnvZ